MYTKEQIIDEMKRVAEQLGVNTLTRKTFEQNTMVPTSTIQYYLGSWSRALKEAGLEYEESSTDVNVVREPEDEDALLKELIRLHDQFGEPPTAALVESKSIFKYRHYAARWSSLSEAFLVARRRYPPEPEPAAEPDPPPEPDPLPEPAVVVSSRLQDNDSPLADPGETIPSNLADFSELGIAPPAEEPAFSGGVHNGADLDVGDMLNLDSPVRDEAEDDGDTGESVAVEVNIPDFEPVSLDEAEMISELPGGREQMKTHQTKTIKLIPQTIKPKLDRKKRRILGDPIDFRGLKFAPVNQLGVAYLFGLVSHELGYIIESIGAEPPQCEGKRCLDTDHNQWERVRIDVQVKSSDFETDGRGESDADVIVCWIHDWEDCHLEVLELRSILQLLEESGLE